MRNTFTSLCLLVLVGSCGLARDEPRVLSWEEYQALVYQEPDTGMYITNGDETAQDLVELRGYYERYLAEALRFSRVRSATQPLIVNVVQGHDDRWSATEAQSITYCVDQGSFGSQYGTVVNAMNSAAGAWESTARVNFVYAGQYDATSCNARNGNVVFNVRQVCGQRYLARSFFPSYSRRKREILVDCSTFGNIKPWSLAGVLRHELGHTLGFRHEHTRPESGTCFEDNSWRALTAYDSASVMHYPQCNGTNNGDLNLTSLDKQGAGLLYP